MTMVSMVVGAVTNTTVRFVAKVTTGPVRVAYATNSGMTSPSFSGSVAVDAQGVAKVSVTGLTANTQYWWQVEDNSVLDTSVTGRFKTLPVAAGTAASFTIAISGDAGLDPVTAGTGGVLASTRLSNHAIFDTIRATNPLMFVHMGDMHYYDLGSGSHGIVGGGTAANYRTAYDDVLLQPRQHQLMREIPTVYVWDDHDYGPNNSDGTLATKANAASVYRERMPHYDLAEGSGSIYHSFHIGRVLFVVSDTRYNRSPNGDTDNASKTMLGSAQKTWLSNLLTNDDSAALVWLMPTPWLGQADNDTWAGFTTERAELVSLLESTGWADRTLMVNADTHVNAICSGAGNPYGGWPVAVVSSLDATPSTASGSQYDTAWHPGRGQWATLAVHDTGGADVTIAVTLWRENTAQSWTLLNTAPTSLHVFQRPAVWAL